MTSKRQFILFIGICICKNWGSLISQIMLLSGQIISFKSIAFSEVWKLIYKDHFWDLHFTYLNNMPQAMKSNLFLYADDSCLAFQGECVKEIEKRLNEDFANIDLWIAKLVYTSEVSIHLVYNSKLKFLTRKNRLLNLAIM